MQPDPVYDLSKSASRLRLALDAPTRGARRTVVDVVRRWYGREAAAELVADLKAYAAAMTEGTKAG